MLTPLFSFCRLILIPLFLLTVNGFAQIPKAPPTFQSPNVASLGLFGDVPVSHFSGLPEIEVPMYTFTDNGVTIPISLSYHASGFRPDMHPGWVGLGWNFSGTYAIHRKVNDMVDDYHNPGLPPFGLNVGFFYNKSVAAPADWNTVPYMQSITRTTANEAKDTEPDEFSFNYPGGSGKFYLDHTGAWKVRCDKPVKVSFDNTFLSPPMYAPSGTRYRNVGSTKSFSGFTITDENGIKYVYGMTTDAIEYSMAFFNQYYEDWLANAWYLTKIIKQEGHEVTLTYQRDSYINQMFSAVNNNIETKVSSGGGVFNVHTSCSNTSQYGIFASYNGQLISPVYLQNISGSNTKVTFVRSTSTELKYPDESYYFQNNRFRDANGFNPGFLPFLNENAETNFEGLSELKFKKLDTIRIETASGYVKRKFVLQYNNVNTERLMLKSVQEIGANNEKKPPYLFMYDSSVPLPPYFANKNDHWGFYNGTVASFDSSSAYYVNYYNKREPNAAYLYAGTLNKIIYPTGGVTEFVYEPHMYRYRLHERRSLGVDLSSVDNTLAGGLRIKKIVSYDINADSVKRTKEYLYNINSNVSSGILGGRIRYYYDDYRTHVANSANEMYSRKLFSSQSVLPGCTNAQNSHIGYSVVQEKLGDGSYTLYYFTNFNGGQIDDGADTTLQPTRTAYEPYASREAERGNLYKEEAYSSAGVLLQKREIFYASLDKSNQYVRALKCRSVYVCPASSSIVEEGTAYKIYTYSYVPIQEKVSYYDQAGSGVTQTNKYFIYDTQSRLVTKDSTWDSKQQNTQTYYRYPFNVLNYTPSGTVPNTQPVAYMVQKNIIGTPLEIIRTKKVSGSEIVVEAQKTEYKNFNTFVKPYQEYVFKHPSTAILKSAYPDYKVTLSGSAETSTVNSQLELRSTYEGYDTKGNLTDVANNQDVKNAFQWSYNQTLPTAKVMIAEPTAGKEYFYEGFEEDPTAGTATPFAGKKYKIGDYTIPYGAPNNKTYWVNYYSLQSGVWIRITKQFFNYLALTEGDAIDEVRVYPDDGQITSYTFDPIDGMTSESDINGVTKIYEYDGLGRLTTIRNEKKEIIKQFAYNYQWWQPTGSVRCKTCAANPTTVSNIQQVEYKDNNPASTTYNQTRWVDGAANRLCVPPQQWQNTSTPLRCKIGYTGKNTGEQEREQMDMNPCSPTFQNTRWVLAGTNTTACPVLLTTVQYINNTSGWGTIKFIGETGTFEYNIYPNTSNTLGQLISGLYDVVLNLTGATMPIDVNGTQVTSLPFSTSDMQIGGTTPKTITINP